MLSNTGGLNGPVSTGKKKRLQFLLEIVTVSKNPCLQKTSRPISVLQKLGGHIVHVICRLKTTLLEDHRCHVSFVRPVDSGFFLKCG